MTKNDTRGLKTIGQAIGKLGIGLNTTHTQANGETSKVNFQVDFSESPDEVILNLLIRQIKIQVAGGHARSWKAKEFAELLDGKTIMPDWSAPEPPQAKKKKLEKQLAALKKAGYSKAEILEMLG